MGARHDSPGRCPPPQSPVLGSVSAAPPMWASPDCFGEWTRASARGASKRGIPPEDTRATYRWRPLRSPADDSAAICGRSMALVSDFLLPMTLARVANVPLLVS